MEFANHLYIGESVAARKEKIMERMKQGKVVFSVYCVTEAMNGKDLYDIYSAYEIRQPYYKERLPKILAIAGSKEEAIGLVALMLHEKYVETEDGTC